MSALTLMRSVIRSFWRPTPTPKEDHSGLTELRELIADRKVHPEDYCARCQLPFDETWKAVPSILARGRNVCQWCRDEEDWDPRGPIGELSSIPRNRGFL